ncbi:MAG: dCTP deaminase [Candidatus Paceibacterota bacterium]
MILSDRDIQACIEQNKIQISPKPDYEKQLGSASLDLRLGNEFKVFEHSKRPFIDTRDPDFHAGTTRLIKLEDDEPFVFHPKEFVLGITIEEVFLPDDITARIDGRSSLGRLGIVVHSTAGHIDPGFRGRIVLEMENIGMIPVLLYPKTRICQLIFQELKTRTSKPYYKKKGAKYAYQKELEESKLETKD